MIERSVWKTQKKEISWVVENTNFTFAGALIYEPVVLFVILEAKERRLVANPLKSKVTIILMANFLFFLHGDASGHGGAVRAGPQKRRKSNRLVTKFLRIQFMGGENT